MTMERINLHEKAAFIATAQPSGCRDPPRSDIALLAAAMQVGTLASCWLLFREVGRLRAAQATSAACAPLSDEAATPKSPAARLAKLERRLKKACRSGDKAAEGTLRVKVEKMRRKAQKQREQPKSPP